MIARAASSSAEVHFGRIGTYSSGIARLKRLRAMLDAEAVVYPLWPWSRVDSVVGWGCKRNTRLAKRFADRRRVPYVRLEDGFLRSVDLGVHGEPPLSLVVDPVGIYYDATRPCWLEHTLEGGSGPDALTDPALLARARTCIDAIREHRLSKYNHAPCRSLGPKTRPRVLVVDQTAGDLSLRLGGVDDNSFTRMVDAALDEHPGHDIIVKTHPDVLAGRKAGCAERLVRESRVRLLTDAVNPAALLDEVDTVYVMTSLLGFEALLARRRVVCFGTPFYAGWGLTDDRHAPVARRSARRSVEAVFAAAYILYSVYFDPETHARCELERVIEHLARQRPSEPSPRRLVAVGFSPWKRAFIPTFLRAPGVKLSFVRSKRAARRRIDADSALVVWGTRRSGPVAALGRQQNVPVWRVEDGFLRSVGLGSDLDAPASLVVDPVGMYYDATRPSRLEQLLEQGVYRAHELERARALRSAIVEARVSKYNVGKVRDPRPAGAYLLVVGQVEGDESLRLGGVDIRRNEALLQAVREGRSGDYVAYKPHPDVLAGNRRGQIDPARLAQLCDEVLLDVSLPDALDGASEVHTMTSLVGFEALLRGIPVFVYGLPFYAGWGLTVDTYRHPRRTRRLSLDELVAGALIRYPRYVHPVSGRYTSPESVVEFLRRAPAETLAPGRRMRRQVRKAFRACEQVLRASRF